MSTTIALNPGFHERPVGSKIFRNIVRVIRSVCMLPEKDINPFSVFEKDLGVDSLDVIEIISRLEKIWGFKLEIENLSYLKYSLSAKPAYERLDAESIFEALCNKIFERFGIKSVEDLESEATALMIDVRQSIMFFCRKNINFEGLISDDLRIKKDLSMSREEVLAFQAYLKKRFKKPGQPNLYFHYTRNKDFSLAEVQALVIRFLQDSFIESFSNKLKRTRIKR